MQKNGSGRSIQLHQFVCLAAHPQLLGIFQGVHDFARVDALQQMDFAVIFRSTHQVRTRLVQRHRVERSQDTYIAHLRILRRSIAVAVHRQLVGYINI